MILFDEFVNTQNILDFLIQRNLLKANFDSILKVDEVINKNVLSVWSKLNGGASLFGNAIYLNDSIEGNISINSSNVMNKLFDQPSVQGNNQKEYVLVPLCSFGSGEMKKCELLEKSKLNFDQHKCFTFNATNLKGGKVEPENGFNFLASFRIPSTFSALLKKEINPLKLILHETDTLPDIHFRTNTFIEIKPGKHYIIRTEATLLEVTESFQKLPIEKRKCKLKENHKSYHQTDCYFDGELVFPSTVH